MNLASILIPSSLEAKQALRLRRFGLAALSYVLAAALLAVAWTFGTLPASAALEIAAALIAVNLGLYAVIRSGYNLRFGDPSLTRFQILVAITVLMYTAYHMDDGRNIALFGCFVAFLFGIFRLNAREFTVVTLYTLAAYALVINLLIHLRPQAIHDVSGEWMSWLGLAGFLPCFTIICGQFNTLRRKLRESELRYRSLTELSSDWYWEQDENLRFTRLSKPNAGQPDIEADTFLGKTRREAKDVVWDEAQLTAFEAIIAARQPFRDFEIGRAYRNGPRRYVQMSGEPIFAADGRFAGYRGIGKDITERKQREEDLRRFRMAMDATEDGIYLVDRATMRFVDVNSAACNMLGLTREQILAAGPEGVLSMSRDDLARIYDAVIADGGAVRPLEMLRTRRDGKQAWIELRRHAMQSEAGWRIVTVARDITQRKHAEDALHQSEERFRSLTEMSSDFYWESDTEHRLTQRGSADKKVSSVSVFQQGTQIGDRRWEIPYLSPDEAGWRAHRAGLDAHLPFRDFELSRLGADGTERHISVSGDPMFDASGAFKGYRGVGTDITARKRAEAALQQQHARLLEAERELLNAHESLAEADRLESVGRLAAGVAHEVKNPLTIIRLGTDYLAKKFSQESNQEVLDDVRAAIDRAELVIRDLLDFSRQKPFAPRPTDINEVLDNAINLIRYEIDRRDIVIIRNRDDPMPAIYADPDRLVQVFINLLTNAAQAIGQVGSIEIVTRSICLSERDLEQAETKILKVGDPVITIDIRDTGPGISADHEKKLFEPFFTTKPVGEGSGLGLAVSRSIVIMHRGSIRISNRPEGGASALLMFRADSEH